MTSGSGAVILEEEEEDEEAEEDVISSSIEEPSPPSSSSTSLSFGSRPSRLPSYDSAINSTKLQASYNKFVLNNEAATPNTNDNKETESSATLPQRPVATYCGNSNKRNPLVPGEAVGASSSSTTPFPICTQIHTQLVSSIHSSSFQQNNSSCSRNSDCYPMDGGVPTSASAISRQSRVSSATGASSESTNAASAEQINLVHTANTKKVSTKETSSKPQIEYVVLI